MQKSRLSLEHEAKSLLSISEKLFIFAFTTPYTWFIKEDEMEFGFFMIVGLIAGGIAIWIREKALILFNQL